MQFNKILTNLMDCYVRKLTGNLLGEPVLSTNAYQIKCSDLVPPTQNTLSTFIVNDTMLIGKTLFIIYFLGDYEEIKAGNELRINNKKYDILVTPHPILFNNVAFNQVLVAYNG